MLIDTHAHLDFFEDPLLVLDRAVAAGVGQVLAIGIGDGPATMHRALDIARLNPRVFASAGIHPQEAAQATEEALQRLAELAKDARLIAVGEIGLDYYHVVNPDPEIQQQAFIAQMKIAAAVSKPILIHCRTSELATPGAKARFGDADAFADILRLAAAHGSVQEHGGVLHCFSGSAGEARAALDAGFYLSFAGNLTYPKSLGIREAARMAPADRIFVETDCPFLAPIPMRGQTNEPAYMVHTAQALAELRGVSPEEIAETTTTNFHRLFPQTIPSLKLPADRQGQPAIQ